ncbi:MAG: hypothetical protein KAJ29_04195 [Alphaproteobacteria bacterium]|nr:hypothetical protein [Alphaproteobacteria bacterium]
MKKDVIKEIFERVTEEDLKDIARNTAFLSDGVINLSEDVSAKFLIDNVRNGLKACLFDQKPIESGHGWEVRDAINGDPSFFVEKLEKTGILSKDVLETLELGIKNEMVEQLKNKIIEQLTEEDLKSIADNVLKIASSSKGAASPETLVNSIHTSLSEILPEPMILSSGEDEKINEIVMSDMSFIIEELEKAKMLPEEVLEYLKPGNVIKAEAGEPEDVSTGHHPALEL